MSISWIALYPQWYVQERESLAQHYPEFQVYEKLLAFGGQLFYYGELLVRPPGGTIRYPVILNYPEGSPFELPLVTPVESLPKFNPDGSLKGNLIPKILDHRHQMPDGSLCLFQRETRGVGVWGSMEQKTGLSR